MLAPATPRQGQKHLKLQPQAQKESYFHSMSSDLTACTAVTSSYVLRGIPSAKLFLLFCKSEKQFIYHVL